MITLPWSDSTAPNVMLEITDKCNLRCNACYAKHGTSHKSISDIERELETAKKLRPLQTVTITGGEPMLHPELHKIIRLLSDSGLKTFLLTNGVLVDANRLYALKAAGLDDILFHVDAGQNRSDIPSKKSAADIVHKQNELIDMAIKTGLDPSISVTIYDDSPNMMEQIIDSFINSSEATMLFLSHAKDPANISTYDRKMCSRLLSHLKNEYNLNPFACINSTETDSPPLWYSFFIPLRSINNIRIFYPYCGTIADSLLIRLGRILTGKYVHRMPKSEALIRFRVFANGIASFRIRKAWRFIRAKNSEACFRHKMIIYDDGPHQSSTGEHVHCSFCPTAVIKKGKLVRVCELQNIQKASL